MELVHLVSKSEIERKKEVSSSLRAFFSNLTHANVFSARK